MFRNLLLLLILILDCSLTIDIKPDNAQGGIAFIPFELANLQDSTKYVSYSFNLSSVEYILTSYSKLKNNCSENRNLSDFFEFEVEKNIYWNRSSMEPIIDKSNILETKVTFLYDVILNSYIDTFILNLNKQEKCQTFERMVRYFQVINKRLNELSMLNTTALEEVISKKFIMRDIRKLLTDYNIKNNSHPFDTLYSFPTNFFDFVDFNYNYGNYQVSLTLSIPLYRKETLYKMFPKPLVGKYAPYIMNTEAKYAFLTLNDSIFYTENDLKENCFWYDKQFYCTKSNYLSDCEDKIINDKQPDKECFTRLPRTNLINSC